MEEKKSKNIIKVISDDVNAAIENASNNLGGQSYSEIAEALKVAGGDDPFFNPTLSQYREGMILNTSSKFSKIRRINVGQSDRKAWVITCAVGHREGGDIKYTGAFNLYPSTLRKQIQVTDELGDQVLDEKKQPVVIDGTGNEVWEASRKCANPSELLSYAMDKILEVGSIVRDFGPSVFVKQADGSVKATSHKLTSLPLFNLVG